MTHAVSFSNMSGVDLTSEWAFVATHQIYRLVSVESRVTGLTGSPVTLLSPATTQLVLTSKGLGGSAGQHSLRLPGVCGQCGAHPMDAWVGPAEAPCWTRRCRPRRSRDSSRKGSVCSQYLWIPCLQSCLFAKT